MGYAALALVDTRFQNSDPANASIASEFCSPLSKEEFSKRGTSGDDLIQHLRPDMTQG